VIAIFKQGSGRAPLISGLRPMKLPCLVISAIVASSLLAASACARQSSDWLVGYWAQTLDEDGKPFDDTIEFRADGTAISYDAACEPVFENTFHIHQDKVYVTARTRKGFVSLLFVPTQDHGQLTMTSVRTANNAVYSRSAPNVGCIPAKS
jgi:hypothetical protein